MYKLLSILLIFSFTFTQEPCIGTCYTEEEEINIENHISTLEQNNELNNVKIKELENMIKLYEEKDKNSQVYLTLQIQKNKLLDDRIKLYNDLVKDCQIPQVYTRLLIDGFKVYNKYMKFNVFKSIKHLFLLSFNYFKKLNFF